MTSVRLESDRPVPTAALETLRSRLTGVALTADDAGFGAAAELWNRCAEVRPRLIVRCGQGSDVVAAVRFARDHELPLAVRVGGFHPAGHAGGRGVVVDLRPMAEVRVDPLGGTAVVGGGATWGAVDAATRRHGLAVPGVPLSRVGVAGSTLGGGFGHLRRAYGLACDSLLGADVVLADGQRVTTSGDELPELLWGLRGGGGNFGVVTALRFRTRTLAEPMLAGPVVHPGASAAAVLRFYRDYTAALRPEVTSRVSLYGAGHPAMTALVPRAAGEPVVAVVAAYVGHLADAPASVAPIRGAAPVLADALVPRRYAQLQAAGDEIYAPGQSAAVGSWYVAGLADALVGDLVAAQAAMPAGAAELHVFQLGGAVARVARMSTAAPHRTAAYLVAALARWRGEEQEYGARQWLAATDQRLRKHAIGGPHLGLTSACARSVDVYGPELYLRLAALKRRFDPDNVFAANQNVEPLA